MEPRKRFWRKLERREVYQEKVKPIVENLERTCYREKIPMFASFAVFDDKKKTEYENVMLSPTTINFRLSDDKIADFIRVIQGYRTISPGDDTEFQFTEDPSP